MRRFIFCIIVFCIFTAVFSVDIYASENVRFSFKADENIKAGKTFSIYLSAVSDDNIGVFRISISFDSEKLEFKSAEINDSNKNEYMKYSTVEDEITVIYMNNTSADSKNLNDIIKLKFSPKSSDTSVYKFKSFLYEIGNKDAEPLECDEMPMISVEVSESGSLFEISAINDEPVPSSEVDFQEESEETKSKPDTSTEENSLTSKVNEYSLSSNNADITFRQDSFYIYMLIGLAVIVAIAVSFKLGAKSGRKNK